MLEYTYEDLYRLTAADYSTGEFFHYTYDAVGNRLTEVTQAGSTSYSYDIANRLISVAGVTYTWDAKGNLLSDGTSTYAYNHANRLSAVSGLPSSYAFEYNGLGDRLQQTVDSVPTTYTLDLNRGLTQVLADGSNTYLYGLARIGEEQPGGWQFHHGDALGSVRQLTDAAAAVTLAQSYESFGSTLTVAGTASTDYAFTGEWADGTGLVYLRARYLDPGQGRFTQRDPLRVEQITGSGSTPFDYGLQNPVVNIDPAGLFTRAQIAKSFGMPSFATLLARISHESSQHVPQSRRGGISQNPFIGSRWGLIAMLLDASPGDTIALGTADITRSTPARSWGPWFRIGFDSGSQTITIGGMNLLGLDGFLANEVNLPFALQRFPAPWRETSPHYYALHRRYSANANAYVDKAMQTSLPDIHSFGVVIAGGTGSFVSDRFGNSYVSIGIDVGMGLPISASYVETYVSGAPIWAAPRSGLPSESDLVRALDGACIEVNGAVIYGGGLGGCADSGIFYASYSFGLATGAGLATSALTIRLGKFAERGWNWAIEDRLRGIGPGQLQNWSETVSLTCP